jgi:hypothetical protein
MMASARESRFSTPPRYLAQLPWIGPILGERFGASGTRLVRLAAAADPLLGSPLAVVFLPVKKETARPERLVPLHAGWVAPIEADGSAGFQLHAPEKFWDGEAHGVLMVLLYDRSTVLYEPATGKASNRIFPDNLPGQIQHLSEGKATVDGPIPVPDLPGPIREEIERRVRRLLEAPRDELELGLIELEREIAPSTQEPRETTFAVASCQYPAGFLDRDVAESSYRRIAHFLSGKGAGALQCLVLLGDQVYVDATAGLFDPSAEFDRFGLPYERLLRTEPLRQVLRRVPLYAMLDDHEIQDNWEPGDADPRSAENLRLGHKSYLRYQRMAGPPQVPASGDSQDPLWYEFDASGLPFFMADTRTERGTRTAQTIADACIMRPSQFDALLEWLDRQNQQKGDTPKFIASPASFLPRHRRAAQHGQPASALRSDGWDGYPSSFYRLLTHIAAKDIRNVIFLSGDEHVSFVVSADITDKATGKVTRIRSIHSSGLYSPFPFANSVAESLCFEDDFEFGDYRCQVARLEVMPGDGFALLRVSGEPGAWSVRCCFDRASDTKAGGAWINVV